MPILKDPFKRNKKRIDTTPQNDSSYTVEMFFDPILESAILFSIDYGFVSESMLERRLNVSFIHAKKLTNIMEKLHICDPYSGIKPRKVLISKEHFLINKVSISNSAKKILEDEENSIKEKMLDLKIVNEAIEEEKNWRRQQKGLNPIECELDLIDSMAGHEFEQWCSELLRKNGFINVKITPGSGDQGVDVLAEKEGIRYAIQCKCYSSDLGNKPVQEVHAGKSFYGCDVAVVMTNQHFTHGAKELASKIMVRLWDREKIVEMIRFEGII